MAIHKKNRGKEMPYKPTYSMSKEEFNFYQSVHRIICSKLGKAHKCTNPDCKSVNSIRFEWALLKGKPYSYDMSNYIQLCASCHKKYDETEERSQRRKMSHIGKRAPHLNRRIKRIGGNIENTYESISIASQLTSISRTSIHNCLSGLSKSAGGFKWQYIT